MTYGFLLLIAAAGYGTLAHYLLGSGTLSTAGGVFFVWVTLAHIVVAAGYLGVGARVFGKSRDGQRSIWGILGCGPYSGAMHVIRRIYFLAINEAPFHRMSDTIYVGRRASYAMIREIPGLAAIVDMTAEFVEPADLQEEIGKGRLRYHCLPTLDGMPPSVEDLSALVAELKEARVPTYIHCAAGHGRAATVAAALLVARGDAADIEDAVSKMRAIRPGIHPSGTQKRIAAAAVEDLK